MILTKPDSYSSIQPPSPALPLLAHLGLALVPPVGATVDVPSALGWIVATVLIFVVPVELLVWVGSLVVPALKSYVAARKAFFYGLSGTACLHTVVQLSDHLS